MEDTYDKYVLNVSHWQYRKLKHYDMRFYDLTNNIKPTRALITASNPSHQGRLFKVLYSHDKYVVFENWSLKREQKFKKMLLRSK